MSAVKVKPKGKTMLKETAGFHAGEHDEHGTGARKPKAKDAAAEKYMREAAKLLGITVSEARERIKQGREAQAEQERAALARGREQSIRFSVENLRDCLTDIHDLANNAKRGEVGALDPNTILHAIESMTVSAREWLDDLSGDLGIKRHGEE